MLGAGVGRQEKFYWLTHPDLKNGIEELENLKAMLAAPPTLESHTSVPQSVLNDMSLAQVALNEELAQASENETEPAKPPQPIQKPRRKASMSSKRKSKSKPSSSQLSSESTSTKQSDEEWLSSIVKGARNYVPIVSPIAAITANDDAKPKSEETTDDATHKPDDANSLSSVQPAPNTRVDITNLSTLFQ
jgi:hypothetical protein